MHLAEVMRKLERESRIGSLHKPEGKRDGKPRILRPILRRMARELGADHRLAGELWSTAMPEARLLAALVEEPDRVSEAQMDRWAQGCEMREICNALCAELFVQCAPAFRKALDWATEAAPWRASESGENSIHGRAYLGLRLMGDLAVRRRDAEDERFFSFLNIIEKEYSRLSGREAEAARRALKAIGSRSVLLNEAAQETVRLILRKSVIVESQPGGNGYSSLHHLQDELEQLPLRRRLGPAREAEPLGREIR